MGKILAAGALALTLAACGGSGGEGDSYDGGILGSANRFADNEETARDFARQSPRRMAEPVPVQSPPPPPPPPGAEGIDQTPETATPLIAYSHSLGIELPVGGVDAMIAQHVAGCQAAGPSTCIVVNSNVYTADENNVNGNLNLRAEPEWLAGFMASIESDAATAGGEITSRSTTAEDLTRTILDTGARLDAQRTLQTRLEGLLANRDGDLGELLSVERELARVTGEIESITAQLRALRLRVAMSSLSIGYETDVPAFSQSRSNPLGSAIGEFFYNMSSAIAAVITAFAFGLPWLFLIGILLWVWLRVIWPFIRRKRAPKT